MPYRIGLNFGQLSKSIKRDLTFTRSLNEAERSRIAKSVSDYIIDHLLVEKPMTLTELWANARQITEDKVSDPAEFAALVDLAIKYISNNSRIFVTKGIVRYEAS